MTFARKLDEIGLQDAKWAGEKGARLGELVRARVNVPPGFVIGAPAYARIAVESQISSRIQSRLSEIEIEDPVELEAVAEDIRKWIEEAPIPAPLEEGINSALDALQGNCFAVRASRVVEDVVNPRASGLEQAFLGVPRARVLEHVRQVWGTLWTSRAMYYRNRKKVAQDGVSIAVVLQTMVASTCAGVLFTANPSTGATDHMHIDATFGLGEAIVAARWKPDHYVVNKGNGAIVEREIVNKPLEVVVAPAGGIEVVPVAVNRQSLPCLDGAQIQQLATLGLKIEECLRQAQDIEWCLAGDEISILQARTLRKK